MEGDGAWTGNTSYSVKSGYPDRRRHLRRQRDPLSNGRAYIQDSTFFIGAEAVGDDLDISTATGMMSVDMSSQNTDGSAMKAYAIVDKSNNAVFVIYAADELNGATNKDDVVYMADDATTRNSSDTLLADLYFLSDMSVEEEAVIEDDYDEQGFYTYSVSDDVYELERNADELTASNTEDGYAEYVVLNEGQNSTVTSVISGTDFDEASDIVGSSKVF